MEKRPLRFAFLTIIATGVIIPILCDFVMKTNLKSVSIDISIVALSVSAYYYSLKKCLLLMLPIISFNLIDLVFSYMSQNSDFTVHDNVILIGIDVFQALIFPFLYIGCVKASHKILKPQAVSIIVVFGVISLLRQVFDYTIFASMGAFDARSSMLYVRILSSAFRPFLLMTFFYIIFLLCRYIYRSMFRQK